MASGLIPPLPSAQPEGRAVPELMSPEMDPGAAMAAQPVDALQGYMRGLTEAHLTVEEIARQFATRPDITEAAQMAQEGLRNLMERIIASADLGVGDESTPIGG